MMRWNVRLSSKFQPEKSPWLNHQGMQHLDDKIVNPQVLGEQPGARQLIVDDLKSPCLLQADFAVLD